MRLINVKSFELEIFRDIHNRPPYAILSHRWIEDEEVAFHDMQSPHRKWMPGWRKIRFRCEQACSDGLSYVWVDTCCINKDSSAELSEAINSMYNWYSDAVTCYAYMNDVRTSVSSSPAQLANEVTRSKWFTRAWTLQELIAPKNVIFFDAGYGRIGSKKDLAGEIQQLCDIPADLLLNPHRLSHYPISLKMSWAACREATRKEDIAYSLFGLFEVNLPLLYGEGERAFIRLQEEIIRHTHDHTIFLWKCKLPEEKPRPSYKTQLPILAPSPSYFKECQDMVKFEGHHEARAYAMANIGLQIELPLAPYHLDVYVAQLDCSNRARDCRYGILLARDPVSASKWHRTCVNGLEVVVLPRSVELQYNQWQKLNILRGSSDQESYSHGIEGKTSIEYQQSSTLYGIKLRAPLFLKQPVGGVRPYAVVAYHDWETTKDEALMNKKTGHLQPHKESSSDSLLSPSSFKHISHFHAQIVSQDKLAQAGLFSLTSNSRASKGKRLAIEDDAASPAQLHIGKKQRKLEDERPQRKSHGIFEMPELTAGTCGIVIFDHLVNGIHALKVGFDFDFRPVVFIATHEANIDSHIENWIRQWRFKHIDRFEHSEYLLRDVRHNKVQGFWELHPDIMRTREGLEIDSVDTGDAPVEIFKGVYGLRSGTAPNAEHWIIKPYEEEGWHITIKLEKCSHGEITAWELTMDRQEEMFELSVLNHDS